MSQTLAQAITECSINIGDLETGVLTSVSSATSAADNLRTEPDGHWTGGALSVLTGSTWEEQVITGWTKSGGVFTTNGFTASRTPTSQYELRKVNYHTRSALKTFIQQAIREVARMSWVSADSRTDYSDLTTYSVGRIDYPVPSGLEFVRDVLYLDISGYNQVANIAALPATADLATPYYVVATQQVKEWNGSAWVDSYRIPWITLPYPQWDTNRTGMIQIQLLDNFRDWDPGCPPIPDGAPLRFLGSRRPAAPVNDTDVLEVEGNYHIVFATARMCLRLARGAQDQQDFNMKFQAWYKLEADAFRGTRRGLPSGSRKVN